MYENIEKGLERVTAKQAAIELNMTIESVHYLMQQGRLPIGYAVRREGRKKHTYYIYRGSLDAEKKAIAEGKCKW